MSRLPATRSSLADKGTSASWGAKATDGSAPFRFFPAQEGQSHSSGASGSQCHGQPATTWDCGRSEARPRTAVDFAVPFSPRSNTPPILGKTALASKARLIFSCPTRAVKGNTRHLPDITAPPSLIRHSERVFSSSYAAEPAGPPA